GLVLPLSAQRNRLAVAPDLPTGHVQVVGGEFRRDFSDRKVQRFEAARIEVDLQLADLAAIHFDGGDAVDLAEEGLEVVFHHAAGWPPTRSRPRTSKSAAPICRNAESSDP